MEKRLASLSSAFVAAGLSAYVLLEAASSALTSTSELKPVFAGAAYEDVFGFGFWAMWALCALLEGGALLIFWLTTPLATRRVLLATLLLVFAAASFAARLSWQREEAVFWSSGIERHAV